MKRIILSAILITTFILSASLLPVGITGADDATLLDVKITNPQNRALTITYQKPDKNGTGSFVITATNTSLHQKIWVRYPSCLVVPGYSPGVKIDGLKVFTTAPQPPGVSQDEPELGPNDSATFTWTLEVEAAKANADTPKSCGVIFTFHPGGNETKSVTGTLVLQQEPTISVKDSNEEQVPSSQVEFKSYTGPFPEGKPNLEFPDGFWSIVITGLPTDGSITSVTATLTLHGPYPDTTQYWKCGPTADNKEDHWYQIPIIKRSADGTEITIKLTDGQLGDGDMLQNGEIVDPGGPGYPLGGTGGAPVFPNIYIGIGAALGAGVLAYFVRRRLSLKA